MGDRKLTNVGKKTKVPTDVLIAVDKIYSKLPDRDRANVSKSDILAGMLRELSGNSSINNSSADVRNQILTAIAVKALVKVGVRGNVATAVAHAVISEPAAAAKLAIGQLFIGGPITISLPFVVVFTAFWSFLLICLFIHWSIRAKKRRGINVIWDHRNDSKAHRWFSKFMLGSGIFLVIYYTIAGLYAKFALKQSIILAFGT